MPDPIPPDFSIEVSLGDPLALARFTRAVLKENGLGYRDQEMHTGVAASLVYGLAQGQRVPERAMLQFASVATLKARSRETRLFWAAVFDRLSHEQRGGDAPPFPAAPERELLPSVEPPLLPPPSTPEQIAALYASLRLPQSREAVLQLLVSLRAVECAAGVSDDARDGGNAGDGAA
jgi:hypothetical protein